PSIGTFPPSDPSPMKVFSLSVLLLIACDLMHASAAASESLSLAGEWRFALDRSAEQTQLKSRDPLPEGDGISQEWFKRDLNVRIGRRRFGWTIRNTDPLTVSSLRILTSLDCSFPASIA